MRSARTSRMRALVCEVSVTMPACDPDREIAWLPRSLIAIAHRAHEIRSPVESSMSISRGSGLGRDLAEPSRTSWSVVAPRADSTATTRAAVLARAHHPLRRADQECSASATDVPPNFITTMPFVETVIGTQDRRAAALKARDGRTAPCPGDLVRVLEVGAHRQAAREARHRDVSVQLAEASAM